MSGPFLRVSRVERLTHSGNTEALTFQRGVNLLVGRPNTGKTKWLQLLDYLLGDEGEHPYESRGTNDTALADFYVSGAAVLEIGAHSYRIERRWRERGVKGKVFVDDEAMEARTFQHWLMNMLGIPLLHFPKGNPMSGQTWPELSFRIVLRHLYRQQRFWSDLADRQPLAEQHAALLQILGLAEQVYSPEYGELVDRRRELEQLRARRTQFSETLHDLARDILREPGLSVALTTESIQIARDELNDGIQALRARRETILARGSEVAFSDDDQTRTAELGAHRAKLLADMEASLRRRQDIKDRLDDLHAYHENLLGELDRMARAEDAGAVFSDLRVTHCPACDQSVRDRKTHTDYCFLCHQHLPEEPVIEGFGLVRLAFERDRLNGEIAEANELITVLERDSSSLKSEYVTAEARLRTLERELEPSRTALGALVQQQVSAVDTELGRLSERERQVGRVHDAMALTAKIDAKIRELEDQIEPLERAVDRQKSNADFGAAAGALEDGMNAYLNAINKHRPGTWQHGAVRIDLSRREVRFRVGRARWNSALGGTDSLYFLMAYHYGLLALSVEAERHAPGLCIIDMPGEFAGQAVADTENFIVQPFIELLERDALHGAQLIITGASFAGLDNVHLQSLHHVHASKD